MSKETEQTEQTEAKAKKEAKAADEALKLAIAKAKASKKYIALKNLCTAKGKQVRKGDEFSCTVSEAIKFREDGAI